MNRPGSPLVLVHHGRLLEMPLPLRRPGKKDRGRGHYENRLALAVSLPVEGFSRGHCFDASRLSTPRSSNEFCSRPSSVCRWSLQETSGGCARRRLAMNCGLQTNHNHAPPNLSPPSHPPHEPVACGQHSFATTHLAPRERETLKKTSEPHSSMPAFRSDNFSEPTRRSGPHRNQSTKQNSHQPPAFIKHRHCNPPAGSWEARAQLGNSGVESPGRSLKSVLNLSALL